MLAALRQIWLRVSLYTPLVVVGVLSLATWWLVKNTPAYVYVRPPQQVTHEPDYYMREFALKTFDTTGQLKSEVMGQEAHHYPDTDNLEITQAQMRSVKPTATTSATAQRAISNGDGSEVQLVGHARVVRTNLASTSGPAPDPGWEFQGEFLHIFVNEERLASHLPVHVTRGADQFEAQTLAFDNLSRVGNFYGQVRGVLVPQR